VKLCASPGKFINGAGSRNYSVLPSIGHFRPHLLAIVLTSRACPRSTSPTKLLAANDRTHATKTIGGTLLAGAAVIGLALAGRALLRHRGTLVIVG
jgi:hypothetical protein